MSLSSSLNFPHRADRPLLSSTDECNMFDQVFDHELYDEGDGDGDGDAGINEFGHDQDCTAAEVVTDDFPRLPSLSGSFTMETSDEQPFPQPWRKGLWCLNHGSLNIDKTRRRGPDTVTAAQLLNHRDAAVQSPAIPSVSPTKVSTKRFVTSPNAAPYQYKAVSRLPLSREQTLSPSPMYAKLPLQAKMQQVETWQQDFKNFSIKTSQPHAVHQRDMALPHGRNEGIANFNDAVVANNAAYAHRLPGINRLYQDVDREQAIDPGLIHGPSTGHLAQPQPSQSSHPSIPGAAHAFDPVYGTTWTTESLHSSNGSHQSSYETLPPSLSSGLSSGISSNGLPHMQMSQNQIWWPQDMTPATPAWSPDPREPYSSIAAPTPKRAATHSYAENMANRTEGLGIQYPDFGGNELHDTTAYYCGSGPVIPNTVSYSPSRAQLMSSGIPPVPPLPFPINSQVLHNTSPFSTPRTTRHSPTRPASPPLSPLSVNPRTSRRHNRSPSRPEQTHGTHRRRKSIHKPGPIKTMDDTFSTNTSNSHPNSTTTRARSRSQSKPPRTPRTPKTPPTSFTSNHLTHNPTSPHPTKPRHHQSHPSLSSTAGTGGIDFVNFTAADSEKLLADVAPSGSSKTRARRNAEAREKRKLLGEAALRAVSSVGGDVEALRRAFWSRT